MSARSFLDSNILVYTDDLDSPTKRRSALDLAKSAVSEGWGVVSTQVLQEYFAVATGKLGVSADIARAKIEIFSRLDLVIVDMPTILSAIDIHRLHEMSFWDVNWRKGSEFSKATQSY